jgi:hypothetical protein
VDSHNEQQRAREGDEACLGTAASERTSVQAAERPGATPSVAAAIVWSPSAHLCSRIHLSTAHWRLEREKEGLQIDALLCAVAHALQVRRFDFKITIAHSCGGAAQEESRAGRGARRGRAEQSCRATGRIVSLFER